MDKRFEFGRLFLLAAIDYPESGIMDGPIWGLVVKEPYVYMVLYWVYFKFSIFVNAITIFIIGNL